MILLEIAVFTESARFPLAGKAVQYQHDITVFYRFTTKGLFKK